MYGSIQHFLRLLSLYVSELTWWAREIVVKDSSIKNVKLSHDLLIKPIRLLQIQIVLMTPESPFKIHSF